MRTALLALICMGMPLALGAGESCTEDAMIVFDGSGSMSEMGFTTQGVPRIAQARQAVRHVMPEIAASRRVGLVVYGPGGNRVCENISVRFGPQWGAAPRVIGEVEGLRPVGGTPLTEAVQIAAEVLQYRRTPGTVVLVTDGDETCGGAPCELAARLASRGRGLTVHVIGFKVGSGQGAATSKQAMSNASCLADITGGLYLSAETAQDLVTALRVTMGCNVIGEIPKAPRKITALYTR